MTRPQNLHEDLHIAPGPSGWRATLDDGRAFACAIGWGGTVAAEAKREGDGATPLGCWPLRRVLYRPDRGSPPATALPVTALTPEDGWCDDPAHAAYNTQVALPFAAGHEVLWRADGLYDIVAVLGHNDDPPVPGAGSAIFLHVMRPDGGPTAGCVALARPDLESVLAALGSGSRLCVAES